MRALAAGLIALLAAGCAAPASVVVPSGPPGLDGFTGCPVVEGKTIPCEADGDSHVGVDVREEVPSGWTCLTFADDRFDGGGHPFPDWYTYYGPFFGDGGSGAGENRMGIYYDTHDDAPSVSGAVVLFSENESRVFTWQGPPSGFVLVPQAVTSTELLAYGVLYPDAGPTKGQFAYSDESQPWITDPGFSVDGKPVIELTPFWSLGPWLPTGHWSGSAQEPYQQWDLVQGGQLAGQRLHFGTARHSNMGWGDASGLAGTAHWGYGRAAPFNATVDADGLSLRSSLQPYLEFFAQFHDLSDPVGLASAQLLCGCKDQPLSSPEGIECFVRSRVPVARDSGVGWEISIP